MSDKDEKGSKGRKSVVPAEDFSNWFSDPFRAFDSQRRAMMELVNEGFSVPRVDIMDRGDSVVVEADMPDVDKKDISLRVSDDTVSIKAEKSEAKESSSKGFYARERSSSGYYRVVKLPDHVEAASAKAVYRNGTLRIEMRKSKARGSHEVSVE